MSISLTLAAHRYITLAPKRLAAQRDAPDAAMGFPVPAAVAQQPAAGLYLQQRVNRKFRAFIVNPERYPLRDKLDNAVIRVGLAQREVVDEPIQPEPGFCGLIGEDFRLTHQSDVVAVRAVADACAFVPEQALGLVGVQARGEVRLKNALGLDGRRPRGPASPAARAVLREHRHRVP